MQYRPPQSGYSPTSPALNLAYITGEISRFEQMAAEAGRVPSHFATLSAAVPPFKAYYLGQRKLFTDISLLQTLDRRLFAVEKWLAAERARREALAVRAPGAFASAPQSGIVAPTPIATGYVPPSRRPDPRPPGGPRYVPPGKNSGVSFGPASPGSSGVTTILPPGPGVPGPSAPDTAQITVIAPPPVISLTGESSALAGSSHKPAARAPLAGPRAGSGDVNQILPPALFASRPSVDNMAPAEPILQRLPSYSPEPAKEPVEQSATVLSAEKTTESVVSASVPDLGGRVSLKPVGVGEAAAGLPAEPVIEPVKEQSGRPTDEPAADLASELVIEPTTESTAEPSAGRSLPVDQTPPPTAEGPEQPVAPVIRYEVTPVKAAPMPDTSGPDDPWEA